MSRNNDNNSDISGLNDVNSRYMRRHPEGIKTMPERMRVKQNQRQFQIIKSKKKHR